MAGFRKLVVISEFMKGRLVANGIPAEKVEVRPPVIRTGETGAEDVTSGRKIDLLFAGQLIRGKGVQLLLAAMARMKTPRTLDIVGTGNDEAYLKQLAEPLGEKVVFHGYSPNPDDAFRGVRAVVLPWRWQEPFGLVGPEALAHGVPLVGFDVGAIRDYLVDGQTGVLVPPGDTDALSKAIDRILNIPDEARAKGLRGRELVSVRFTDAGLLNGWQDLIRGAK